MRDVTGGELVAVDGRLLYHLDDAEGLGIADVADPDHPREIARVPFVGTPIALYLRPPLAWIAYVDWDAGPGSSTVVRAIDVARPDAPRALGGASVRGVAAGTALVDGVLYALSGSPAQVRSFRVAGDRLAVVDDVRLAGRAAALAASTAGLAAVTTTETGLSVSWLDLPRDRPGALVVRGTQALDGGFAAWERGLVDADPSQTVKLVTCSSPACDPDEEAWVRIVDFSEAAEDVRATTPIAVGRGVPAARFAGDDLYVASDSRLRVVRLHPTPRIVGSVALRGDTAALRVHDETVLAIGTSGGPPGRVRIVIDDVDVHAPTSPRLRGAAAFGGVWTWSPAAEDARAVSIDPSSDLLAIPFSTWRAGGARYATGAEVVALTGRGPTLREALPTEGHVERALFVDGHLLAVGGGRVRTFAKGAPGGELGVR